MRLQNCLKEIMLLIPRKSLLSSLSITDQACAKDLCKILVVKEDEKIFNLRK